MSRSPKFEEYVKATGELKRVDVSSLTVNQKKAFFVNIYNALVIHAFVVKGPPTNTWGRLKVSLHQFLYADKCTLFMERCINVIQVCGVVQQKHFGGKSFEVLWQFQKEILEFLVFHVLVLRQALQIPENSVSKVYLDGYQSSFLKRLLSTALELNGILKQ